MAQKLTFSQFGTEFVRLALTEKVLYDSIGPELAKQQMPAIDEHTGPAHVTGRAQMRLNQLSVKRRDDASIADQNVVFDVSFGIHLTLYIKVAVAQENYEVDAGVVLRFIAETWRSPLSFNVHALPVPGTAIKVNSVGAGNWADLVKRFAGLDQSVREALVKRLNDALRTPHIINVEDMITHSRPPDFHPH